MIVNNSGSDSSDGSDRSDKVIEVIIIRIEVMLVVLIIITNTSSPRGSRINNNHPTLMAQEKNIVALLPQRLSP